jgi:heat shock protein HtpX
MPPLSTTHSQPPLGSFLLLLATVYLQLGLWCQWLPAGLTPVVFGVLLIASTLGMLLAYWSTPAGLFSLMPMRPVVGIRHPAWHLSLARLARQLKITPPQLHQATSPLAVAFALGGSIQRSAIVLEEEFVSALTQEEVDAILAHELCHIALGHTWRLTLLQGALIPLLFPLALILGGILELVSGRRAWFGSTAHKLLSGLPYLFFPLTSLLVMMLMRRWEFAADKAAAQLVGKENILATLRCLHGVFMPDANWNQLTAFEQRRFRRLFNYFSTHPSIPQRITTLWRN